MRVLTLFGYILKRAPGQPATTCQNQVLGINLSYRIVIMGEIVNSVDKNWVLNFRSYASKDGSPLTFILDTTCGVVSSFVIWPF